RRRPKRQQPRKQQLRKQLPRKLRLKRLPPRKQLPKKQLKRRLKKRLARQCQVGANPDARPSILPCSTIWRILARISRSLSLYPAVVVANVARLNVRHPLASS